MNVAKLTLRNLNLGILLILTSAACVSTEKINSMMASWEGRHQSELIAKWGPPDQVTTDGKSGSIVVYEEYINLGQSGGHGRLDSSGNVHYTPGSHNGYTRQRSFYVDSKGYIYRWRWKGR